MISQNIQGAQMNTLYPVSLFCSTLLLVAACTPLPHASTDATISHPAMKPIDHYARSDADSVAGSVSPPAEAFIAFGDRPVAWQAIVDGPLLQVERNSTDIVTLVTERIAHPNGVEYLAMKRMLQPARKYSKHNVHLDIVEKPCANAKASYKLSATLYYGPQKYTGCAIEGTLAANKK